MPAFTVSLLYTLREGSELSNVNMLVSSGFVSSWLVISQENPPQVASVWAAVTALLVQVSV